MATIASDMSHMTNQTRFKFNPEKAIEVILYIANRVSDPGFHRLSKILYFADREHLSEYGRFICGDNYVAMKHGPVPSGTYDILKYVRGDGINCNVPEAMEAFKVNNNKNINANRDANLEVLSESEIECLNNAIKNYGTMSFGKLTEVSHDAAWNSADDNDFIEIEQIAATLPDAENLLEHLKNPYPD